MQKGVKLQSKFNSDATTYFKFFASLDNLHCFWHTPNGSYEGLELSRVDDWTPINTTWDKIRKSIKRIEV